MSEPVAIPFKTGDPVRHKRTRRVMYVTGIDAERGRWVCCRYRTAPDTWHHELFAPDLLEPAPE